MGSQPRSLLAPAGVRERHPRNPGKTQHSADAADGEGRQAVSVSSYVQSDSVLRERNFAFSKDLTSFH